MSALDAAAALPATADMEVELTADRLARNLDLVLLLDVSFVDGTTTVGADSRQRGLVGFVDVLRRRALGLKCRSRYRSYAWAFSVLVWQPLGEGAAWCLLACCCFSSRRVKRSTWAFSSATRRCSVWQPGRAGSCRGAC
jgi:hypothetical protein